MGHHVGQLDLALDRDQEVAELLRQQLGHRLRIPVKVSLSLNGTVQSGKKQVLSFTTTVFGKKSADGMEELVSM